MAKRKPATAIAANNSQPTALTVYQRLEHDWKRLSFDEQMGLLKLCLEASQGLSERVSVSYSDHGVNAEFEPGYQSRNFAEALHALYVANSQVVKAMLVAALRKIGRPKDKWVDDDIVRLHESGKSSEEISRSLKEQGVLLSAGAVRLRLTRAERRQQEY